MSTVQISVVGFDEGSEDPWKYDIKGAERDDSPRFSTREEAYEARRKTIESLLRKGHRVVERISVVAILLAVIGTLAFTAVPASADECWPGRDDAYDVEIYNACGHDDPDAMPDVEMGIVMEDLDDCEVWRWLTPGATNRVRGHCTSRELRRVKAIATAAKPARKRELRRRLAALAKRVGRDGVDIGAFRESDRQHPDQS